MHSAMLNRFVSKTILMAHNVNAIRNNAFIVQLTNAPKGIALRGIMGVEYVVTN